MRQARGPSTNHARTPAGKERPQRHKKKKTYDQETRGEGCRQGAGKERKNEGISQTGGGGVDVEGQRKKKRGKLGGRGRVIALGQLEIVPQEEKSRGLSGGSKKVGPAKKNGNPTIIPKVWGGKKKSHHYTRGGGPSLRHQFVGPRKG